MRLCVHSSKPYVFLSLSSQSGLEVVDQCVVTNAGMRSGKEVACGLLSQNHVTRWFVCSRKKGRQFKDWEIKVTCAPFTRYLLLQVKQFLERHSDYVHEPITCPSNLAQQNGNSSLQGVFTAEGSIATFPHLHGVVDGSFAARLRRTWERRITFYLFSNFWGQARRTSTEMMKSSQE
jgi:hypothetical protein